MSRTTYPKGFPPKGEGKGQMYDASRLIYWAKRGFEYWWLWRWF